MAGTTRVSVPGKLILSGEHAAVYGNPALVAAVGRRLRVQIARRADRQVHIEVPALGYVQTTGWEQVIADGTRARAAWEAYAADPSPERFRALTGGDDGTLVRVALAETVRGREGLPGVDVQIDSELPIGAGLGSSAAAAVGVVTAMLATLDGEPAWDRVPALALEVERTQPRPPSGIDTATVFRGGVLWVRRGESDLVSEPVAVRPELLDAVRVYDTGRPAEGTGQVVAAVRALRDADPEGFAERLRQMEESTRQLRAALSAPGGAIDDLLAPIRDFQRRLQELGVVPAAVSAIIAAVERAGGAAKISGAGALSGDGGGCILAVHPEQDVLGLVPELRRLRRIDAALGVEGARLEAVA